MSKKKETHFTPDWESLDTREIPSWFPRAKFGIFIHWGVYSVPAWKGVEEGRYASYAEWYYSSVMGDEEKGGADFHRRNYGDSFAYRDFAPQFRAELFEPDSWADLFKASGARYVVLTTKHHDGFCLWPTKVTAKKGWNAGEVGPCRDLVGDLTRSVRGAGLKMGLYYSVPEWETHSTDRRPAGTFIPREIMDKNGVPADRYVSEILEPQLKELVENYAPSVIFSDGGEWDYGEEYFRTKEFLSWLYNEAPNRDEVVVNDRWAKGMPGCHGDYFSSEYEDTDAIGPDVPWEENRGIGNSYGFNRAESLDDYRSPGELLAELVSIVSRGGNLLLNVGPRADGKIPVYQEFVLREIGKWLTRNGEGIYDTRPCFAPALSELPEGVFATCRDRNLYLFLTGEGESTLTLKGVKSRTGAFHLASGEELEWQQDGDDLRIGPNPCLRGSSDYPLGFVIRDFEAV